MNNTRRDQAAALAPYRILDLTEYGSLIGPRTLADLGADVIKIEPPGGSPSRIGPYYRDMPEREKSLFWFAYCANKRGITLNLETKDGQNIFKQLVRTADAVVESWPPGYLSGLGLGYEDLTRLKPDIIMASISPFGQTGPKAHYYHSDLTAWASGGVLYICGDADRPPVWIGFPQAGLFGGMDAANATIAAIYYRGMTGEGQYIDVSLQECAISPTLRTTVMWALNKYEHTRAGLALVEPTTRVRFGMSLRCQDGDIVIYMLGSTAPFTSSMDNLIAWMDDEGMAPNWLKDINWTTDYDATKINQKFIDRVENAIERFTLTKTKNQLYEEGIQRRILMAPMQTTREIAGDPQLLYRDFWWEIEHPELQDKLTYVGPSIGLTETPVRLRRRAPLIGEHNQEIYAELGLSRDELIILQSGGII
jgi:crotonobetainyl-CoA:carnitine CoA-transferase CaiB-like acyl-CoA transferase